jgi:hypothetical protein
MPTDAATTRIGPILLLLAPALLAGCELQIYSTDDDCWDRCSYVEESEFLLEGEAPAAIDARTTNGSISVTGTSSWRRAITVRLEVRADSRSEARDFARLVAIHFERSGDLARIHAAYPTPWHGVSVTIDHDVVCAPGTDLTLRTVNGGIVIDGTTAGVDAVTTNGSIRADLDLLAGAGHLATTSGEIDVQLGACSVPLWASTVNGPVEVTLPSLFCGLLDARTTSGRIYCGVTLSEIDSESETTLVGRIGEGRDTPITLRCTNGNIRIR